MAADNPHETGEGFAMRTFATTMFGAVLFIASFTFVLFL